MASLSNITLSITNGPDSTSRNVTVGGTMSFDAGDVGKTFRLEIQVFGEDKSGDNLPAEDPVGDDNLYTFKWGSLWLKLPYKQITVSTAGSQTFSETRAIGVEALDEDKGKVVISEQQGTPVYMMRKDEVYAKVSLSIPPATAKSPVVASPGV